MTKDELISHLITLSADGKVTLKAALEQAYARGYHAGADAPRLPPGVRTWNAVHPTDRTDGGLTVEFMNGVRVDIPLHRDKRGLNV